MKKLSLKMCRMPRLRNEKASVFFCVDDVIATVADYYGRSYEYMYCDALEFSFEQSGESIGKRIKVPRLFEKQLMENCGIRLIRFEETMSCYEKIRECIDRDMPVMVAMNAFWCPWDWRYQEIEDGGHAIIVYGYDEEAHTFICLDPYYEKEKLTLDLELLLKGQMEVYSFQKCEYRAKTGREMIDKSLKHYFENNLSACIDRISSETEQFFSFKKEILDYDPGEEYDEEEFKNRIAIEDALTDISNNRQRYAVFIRKIVEGMSRDAVSFWENKAVALSKDWDTLRYMLLKAVFVGDEGRVKRYVPGKLREIAEKEAAAIRQFGSIFEEFRESGQLKTNMNCSWFSCEISSLLNAEGVGSEKNKTADFDGRGGFFKKEDLSEGISFGGTTILIAGTEDGQKDHISCIGQELLIPECNPEQIVLLGCSDFGDCSDVFTCVYADGSRTETRVELPEWQPDLSHGQPDNTLAVVSTYERDAGDLYENEDSGYLYVRNLFVCSDKKLQKIIFPNMPNMHIFSVMIGERKGE